MGKIYEWTHKEMKVERQKFRKYQDKIGKARKQEIRSENGIRNFFKRISFGYICRQYPSELTVLLYALSNTRSVTFASLE